MGSEGGVVAAAVLHMKHQGNIQYLGFQRGVRAVGTKNMQDIFGCGKLRYGLVDKQAVAVMIVAVSLIAVNGQHGKQTDQLHTLP